MNGDKYVDGDKCMRWLVLISVSIFLADLAYLILFYNQKGNNMIKKINLMYRRLMFKFSKQDIKAVLKYDPLNLLQ